MAQGSHQTYGGWEPRVCVDCGCKLTLKVAAMHYYPHGDTPWSLCHPCLLARRSVTCHAA